jgi:hypothetical protein
MHMHEVTIILRYDRDLPHLHRLEDPQLGLPVYWPVISWHSDMEDARLQAFSVPFGTLPLSSRASDSKEHLTATERLGEPRSAGPLLKAGHVRHGGCHADLVLTARDDRASSISERRPRC